MTTTRRARWRDLPPEERRALLAVVRSRHHAQVRADARLLEVVRR